MKRKNKMNKIDQKNCPLQLTYVGEISEPSIRGVLTACSAISATLGLFLVYLMNTFMPWRSVGLICLIVPLITMIAVCFIPETP